MIRIGYGDHLVLVAARDPNFAWPVVLETAPSRPKHPLLRSHRKRLSLRSDELRLNCATTLPESASSRRRATSISSSRPPAPRAGRWPPARRTRAAHAVTADVHAWSAPPSSSGCARMLSHQGQGEGERRTARRAPSDGPFADATLDRRRPRVVGEDTQTLHHTSPTFRPRRRLDRPGAYAVRSAEHVLSGRERAHRPVVVQRIR